MRPQLARLCRPCFTTCALILTLSVPLSAHVMVAQHATLRFQPQGAYLLASIPVSALKGVDDDGDQRLSRAELRAHQALISRQVLRGLQLLSAGRPLPLEGLLLNLSNADHQLGPTRQLLVMGRFKTDGATELALRCALFGAHPSTQKIDFALSHGRLRETLTLTPAQPHVKLSPALYTP